MSTHNHRTTQIQFYSLSMIRTLAGAIRFGDPPPPLDHRPSIDLPGTERPVSRLPSQRVLKSWPTEPVPNPVGGKAVLFVKDCPTPAHKALRVGRCAHAGQAWTIINGIRPKTGGHGSV